MMDLTIQFRDKDPAVADALTRSFEDVDAVDVSCGDIFDLTADAVLSPANSFGFMDGGIDAVYLMKFGTALQPRVQAVIRDRFDGELAVGSAFVLDTEHHSIPFLVCSPTMRVPLNIQRTVNAYLAFRAALLAVRRFNREADGGRQIGSLLSPGFGTAAGQMDPLVSAVQLRRGYDAIVGGKPIRPDSTLSAFEMHIALSRGKPDT